MKFLVVCAMVLLLGACQTPMQSGSQCVVEPGSLAAENTFSWRDDVSIDLDDATGYISPLAVKAIEASVIRELGGKGFQWVENSRSGVADSDLELALVLRTRRELVAFENAGNVCADADCWERIDMGSETRMEIRTIGFLAADVFYNGEPIWRGWVETYLYPKDRDAVEEVIAKAIPRLFETFPP